MKKIKMAVAVLVALSSVMTISSSVFAHCGGGHHGYYYNNHVHYNGCGHYYYGHVHYNGCGHY